MNTKAPTVAEEMAKFAGFTTNNGETVRPDDAAARRGPGDRNVSDEEARAGVKVVGEQPRGKAAEQPAPKPAKVELTDDEKDAVLNKAREGLGDGEELTTEEEAEALAAALSDKRTKAGKPGGNDRVKRAQEGRRRAEARAARAEGKLTSLEARLAALESGGKAPLTGDTKTPKEDAEPLPKDYEFGEVDPKYIRALARWEVRQELAATSKTQETKQQNSQQERAAAEYAEKKEAFEDAGLSVFDDFQEIVLDTVSLPKSDPAAWPLSATVGKLLLESEFGPHIAYALASDPKEAKRVDKLSAAEQQRWFFRQEAKFEAENVSGEESGEQDEANESARRTEREAPKAAPRQVSKAPPPPRRNNGGSGNKTVSAATTDFRAFEAMANQPAKR